jgi:hypothetical protein
MHVPRFLLRGQLGEAPSLGAELGAVPTVQDLLVVVDQGADAELLGVDAALDEASLLPQLVDVILQLLLEQLIYLADELLLVHRQSIRLRGFRQLHLLLRRRAILDRQGDGPLGQLGGRLGFAALEAPDGVAAG